MKFWISVSMLVFTPFVLAQSSPPCKDLFLPESKGANAQCKSWRTSAKLKSKQRQIGEQFPDGSVLANPMVSSAESRKLEDTPIPPANKDRIESVFKSLKDSIKDMIVQETSPSKLSPYQKYLLERLDELQITWPKIPWETGYPGCFGSGAYYLSHSHRIRLCSEYAHLPTEALLPILAHEIGHSLDPCLFTIQNKITEEFRNVNVYEKKHRDENFERFSKLGKMTVCVKNKITPESEAEEVVRAIEEIATKETTHFYAYRVNPDLYQKLIDCKIFEGQPIKPPVEIDQHFLIGMHQCVRNSLGLKSQLNARQLDYLLFKGSLNGSSEDEVNLPNQGICSRKTSEPFADQAGAKILAHFLSTRSQPLRSGYENSLMYWFQTMNCKKRDESFQSGEYLPRKDRIETFLQYPEIQRAARCDGNGIQRSCIDSKPFEKPHPNGVVQ